MAFRQSFKVGTVVIMFNDVMPDGFVNGIPTEREEFRKLLAKGTPFTLDTCLTQSADDSLIEIIFEDEGVIYTCHHIDIIP